MNLFEIIKGRKLQTISNAAKKDNKNAEAKKSENKGFYTGAPK